MQLTFVHAFLFTQVLDKEVRNGEMPEQNKGALRPRKMYVHVSDAGQCGIRRRSVHHQCLLQRPQGLSFYEVAGVFTHKRSRLRQR